MKGQCDGDGDGIDDCSTICSIGIEVEILSFNDSFL